MMIIKTIHEMQAEADRLRSTGRRIGFVPTMGYLHEGHLSLIRVAKRHADAVGVSIFVNPTQFGPGEDLAKYPRDFERDERLCLNEGVDFLFYPSEAEMYPENYFTYVNVEEITDMLCGASRPGHFRGVTTVVAKLFHAVKPHSAVFGQKDAQQAAVIRRMARDLNFDIEILVAPIVREPDGLAMSSRNVTLSPAEREDALSLNRSLRMAEEMIRKGEWDSAKIVRAVRDMIESKKHARIDYVSVVDPDTFQPLDAVEAEALIAVAVYVGKTRLIDNILVNRSCAKNPIKIERKE
jgi:pantoate--beta-alanine ligase